MRRSAEREVSVNPSETKRAHPRPTLIALPRLSLELRLKTRVSEERVGGINMKRRRLDAMID